MAGDCSCKPNYERECEGCDMKPTIDLYSVDGSTFIEHTNLCGPCMFGEADAIDPETW
jgi:hypothetical protein